MRCPYCGSLEDRVANSRSSREGRAVRRRRECTSCGKRFTTFEYVEDVSFSVIKSDERREPFDRQKLLNGIRIACTKRPVSIAQIEAIVDEVESEVYSLQEREVRTKQIGELVMDKLRRLDEIAYVRFASVYRAFKDKREFMEELSRLLS